jgi:hypothetical protein
MRIARITGLLDEGTVHGLNSPQNAGWLDVGVYFENRVASLLKDLLAPERSIHLAFCDPQEGVSKADRHKDACVKNGSKPRHRSVALMTRSSQSIPIVIGRRFV